MLNLTDHYLLIQEQYPYSLSHCTLGDRASQQNHRQSRDLLTGDLLLEEVDLTLQAPDLNLPAGGQGQLRARVLQLLHRLGRLWEGSAGGVRGQFNKNDRERELFFCKKYNTKKNTSKA